MKLALESLESRILVHEKNELAWGEKYEFQNYELSLDEYAIRKKIIKSKTTDLNTKTNDEDDVSEVQSVSPVKTNETQTVWRPNGSYLDHVSKDSGSFMLKKVEYGYPEILLTGSMQMMDMVALSHMTGNKACDNGTEFKNYAMNELYAKKGIKREFSVARTLQQNEAVNTACYVLNRVLVTKPQNKTPYELLIDSLGKFDGKSDEGYLLGYSTTSKAFRVYNKRTKRVEENLHIDFLEDQPNVAGTGPNWMFDLDFLTNSMNYIPVSVENQVNVDVGTQDSYVASSLGKDKGPTQEYILLLLQPHRTRIPVEDVAPAAHEKPFESSPKDNDVQDSEDVADKEGQHQMTEDEQVLHDELEKMIAQEVVAKALDDATRQAFEEEKRNIASQKRANQTTCSILDIITQAKMIGLADYLERENGEFLVRETPSLPTASAVVDDIGRIFPFVIVNSKEYHSDVLAKYHNDIAFRSLDIA
ncbi:putative ribonuclease H-like domain-containing protein [Tanacetum coccineum]